MARYTGPVCKLCRREGEKLFLKGARCFSAKCAFEKRAYLPGQHGQTRRGKLSEYGIQLREKQKLKRMYGVLEAQFRSYYEKASRQKGITGENLLQILESRLDNVIYRLGFAPSRNAARQMVLHRHFIVNGRPVNVPSFRVKSGDVISVKEKSRKMSAIHDSMRRLKDDALVPWLRVDKAKMEGEFVEKPARQDIPITVQENLIVELYSK
ncbi:MAG: 30S ribosomal protein S4 [Calditrichaeota bacterium]|nr:30S ribosomal protein S4 [Calditrichota bacterium]MCB0302731.1 30S ribosomal protein S4 [Calditrichota bacterium]MCB0315568.1 30S ribosomal protein S4 [Calditrichota bacterium]MCB9087237.1 30S ribosomal protein S4 [Calditrichia bacterium]